MCPVTTVGSLCSGIGGLDAAVCSVFDADLAFVSEIDPGACAVIAHRFPDVPNLGDFTQVVLPDVDVLCAGFPCQPVSQAGKRAGTDDDRWLFDDILDAVGRMGSPPGVLVFENVPGLLSANGGDAMARVVHGLAGVGFRVEWGVLGSGSVGGCHRRDRVWIVAAADPEHPGRHVAPLTRGAGQGQDKRGLLQPQGRAGGARADLTLLPPPRTTDGTGHVDDLLPTPTAWLGRRPSQADGDPERWANPERSRELSDCIAWLGEHGDGGLDLSTAVNYLPTPRAQNGEERNNLIWERPLDQPQNLENAVARFGRYTEAVARWARLFGPPPAPTVDVKGKPRLNPDFCEWMMGYPPGWTDVPGVSRTARLKCVGNSVQPQTAAAALPQLLARLRATVPVDG